MTDQNFYYTIDPKTQAITPIQLAVTMRDQFAMAALTGLLAYSDRWSSCDDIAQRSFGIADAMMEARK